MADELDKSLNVAAGKKPSITPPKRSSITNVAKAASPTSHLAAKVQVQEVQDTFEYDTAMRMAFIGAGQGGGKIAQAFWDIGYRRVGAFNTTDSDFHGLAEEMPKLSMDIGGAAKNMQLARQSLIGRDEELWDLFTRAWGNKFDCAIITVGAGGGSGSGTALPLVLQARKYMESKGLPVRVGAIIALPSVEEGQQTARNAVTVFEELLAAKVSPLIVIDNDSVNELYHPSMSQLLPKSNELVSQLLHLMNQLAALKSKFSTFDRAEFAQLLDSGIVVLGSADIDLSVINSPANVSEAIKDQLENSVLAKVDLRTGRKGACVFVASNEVLDTYSREYFDAGFTMVNRIVGSAHPEGTDVVVHRGLYSESDDGLQCYIMIGELAPPEQKLTALRKQAGLQKTPRANSVSSHLRVD